MHYRFKCVQSDAFLIIGYQPDGRGGIANLKLAIEENGALRVRAKTDGIG
jgi:hypothetical protein